MNKNKIYRFLIAIFFAVCSLNCFAHAEDPITKIVNIVFVGDKESGKTYFRKALHGEIYSSIAGSAGTTDTILVSKNITFDMEKNQHLKLMMYDTSGYEAIAEQVKNKLTKEANFVVLTIDGTKTAKVGTYYTYTDIVAQNQIEWYHNKF